MPPGIISEDLKENITIEGEIMKWYKILNKRIDKKQYHKIVRSYNYHYKELYLTKIFMEKHWQNARLRQNH